MKKFFKIAGISLLILMVLLGGALGLFVYKVKNGFPVSYETDPPELTIPSEGRNVLLFSKTTGFRHEESILAGIAKFEELATKEGWFLYQTESAGIFNVEQLGRFDAVIFNNSTGRVLTDEQRIILKEYIESGGKLIGIHGAGDDSHHWDWYEQSLLGAKFSHHPLNPQLQEAEVKLDEGAEAALAEGLENNWEHTDEWYIFFENPRVKGFDILYTINGDEIIPDGNLLWMKDKNWGMGEDHPVAWSKRIGEGKTFYTSMGHHAEVWEQEPFIEMLINAVNWE